MLLQQLSLTGRKALVTGASRGIAEGLSVAGTDVAIAARYITGVCLPVDGGTPCLALMMDMT